MICHISSESHHTRIIYDSNQTSSNYVQPLKQARLKLIKEKNIYSNNRIINWHVYFYKMFSVLWNRSYYTSRAFSVTANGDIVDSQINISLGCINVYMYSFCSNYFNPKGESTLSNLRSLVVSFDLEL